MSTDPAMATTSANGASFSINASTSKQLYSFAKLDRFGTKPKRDMNRSCYETHDKWMIPI